MADQFSHQYYTVFSAHLRYLYRFYDAASTMTVSEVLENGSVRSNSGEGQTGIHNLVLDLFEDTVVKLSHVLPQFSQDGGIVMQVNGMLIRKGVERCFTQSFFLAVQEKGYYVLNDILHITPSTPATSPRKENPPAGAPPAQVRINPARKPKVHSRQEAAPTPHAYGHMSAPTHANGGHEVPHGAPSGGHPSEEGSIPNAKPTYAESLKVSPGNGAAAPRKANTPEARAQRPNTPASPVETPPSQKAGSVGVNAHLNGAGGAGTASNIPQRLNTSSFPRNSAVFVRDIPPNVDENSLQQAFAQYGDVTNVVIRNGRRDLRFAFVDFATTEAMDECLRKGVTVGNRQLFIEEKKPLVLRNKSRSS